jgi:hypothetical protein
MTSLLITFRTLALSRSEWGHCGGCTPGKRPPAAPVDASQLQLCSCDSILRITVVVLDPHLQRLSTAAAGAPGLGILLRACMHVCMYVDV